MPVEPLFLDLISQHSPLVIIDEHKFTRLLIGSLSLNVAEKKRVFDAVPTLSQYQFDELSKNFEEERLKLSDLEKEHPDDVKALDKKCLDEVAILKTLYLYNNPETQKTLSNSSFFNGYQAAEEALLKLAGEEAEKIIQDIWDNRNFYLYEQLIKAKVCQGDFSEKEAQQLIQQAIDSGLNELTDAVRLFIKMMRLTPSTTETLQIQLENFKPIGELKWLHFYLLSLFYAFMTSMPNAYQNAYDYIGKAFNAIDGVTDLKGPLLLQFKRCQLFIQQYDATYSWALDGDIFQYLDALAFVLDSIKNKVNQTEIFDWIIKDAQQNLLDTVEIEQAQIKLEKEKPSHLFEKSSQAMQKALVGLGFQITDSTVLSEIENALGEKQFEQAEILLNQAQKQPYPYLIKSQLWLLQIELWEYLGQLDKETKKYRRLAQQIPSAWNTWCLFRLLYQKEHSNKQELLVLAQQQSLAFWFLPVFQANLFTVEHTLFPTKKFNSSALDAMQRLIALGPSIHSFDLIANYYRWDAGKDINKHQTALISGLYSGVFCQTDFALAILSAIKLKWFELTLSLFLLSTRKKPYSNESYNCFAIGLGRTSSVTFLELAANYQAILFNPKPSSCLFSNSTAAFKSEFPHWTLYRAALSIFLNPQHAWIEYPALTDAAVRLNKPEFYLPAYYVGTKYGYEWEDNEQTKLHQVLSSFLKKGQLFIPQTQNCAYLSFIAYALIQENDWLIAEKELLAPSHGLYSVLKSIETLEKHCKKETFFLKEEARQQYQQLCLRDDWLLLRHPLETGLEHQNRKIARLKELVKQYPEYQCQLEQTINHWQRRQLYSALSGGRIAHDHLTTINKATADFIKNKNDLNEHLLIIQAQLKKYNEYIKEIKLTALDQILIDYNQQYQQLNKQEQQNLKADKGETGIFCYLTSVRDKKFT